VDHFFAPPTPELPARHVAEQSVHVDLAALFPQADFWDRACALFLSDLTQALRARDGNLQVGRLLQAIREAPPPDWLVDSRLFGVIACETYQRVLAFAKAAAALWRPASAARG
jgi:hypothetical protein